MKKILGWLAIGGVVTASLLVIANKKGVKGVFVLAMEGTSMEPTIQKGSLVIVKAEKEYQPGEIISFGVGKGTIVTHRLIRWEGTKAITRGDRNEKIDSWQISKKVILGKVIITIPWLGWVVLALKTQIGFIGGIIIPATIIIYQEVVNIINILIQKNDQKKD